MDGYTPQQAILALTAARYAGYSKAQRELHAGRIREKIFDFQNIIATGQAGVGAGDPVTKEIAASGLMSLFMETDADAYVHSWPIPPGFDVNEKIELEIEWSQEDTAGTGSCLWTIKYLPVVMGTTTLATPSTVLDVPIVNQADLGPDIPQLTSVGEIAAGTSAIVALRPGVDKIAFLFEYTTETTITDAALIAAYIGYGIRFG